MSWIAWIIICIIAGMIAEKITSTSIGVMMNLVVSAVRKKT